MTIRTAVLALSLLSGCAGDRASHAQRPVGLVLERQDGPQDVNPGAVELLLRNVSRDALTLPRPGAAFLLVAAQSGDGRELRCESPPWPPARLDPVDLAPGAELRFSFDLAARCAVEGASEWLAAVRFAVPPEARELASGDRVWVGVTEPVRVQIARRAEEAPPPEAGPSGPPPSAWPPGAGHPMRPTGDAPRSLAACIGAELERRSLDPWGLPARPGGIPGPPQDLGGRDRLEYVLERVPGIRVVCATPVSP